MRGLESLRFCQEHEANFVTAKSSPISPLSPIKGWYLELSKRFSIRLHKFNIFFINCMAYHLTTIRVPQCENPYSKPLLKKETWLNCSLEEENVLASTWQLVIAVLFPLIRDLLRFLVEELFNKSKKQRFY